MVLKQWPMRTLIGKHAHACRVLQNTHWHPHIHSLQTLADVPRLIQTDQVCTLSHTRRRAVDKTYTSEGVTLALSVFIALINGPLASAHHSL